MSDKALEPIKINRAKLARVRAQVNQAWQESTESSGALLFLRDTLDVLLAGDAEGGGGDTSPCTSVRTTCGGSSSV